MTFVFLKLLFYISTFLFVQKTVRRAVVVVEVLEMIVFSFTFVSGWMAYEVGICYCYCLTCLLCALSQIPYLLMYHIYPLYDVSYL